jgi:hypothetical protein
MGGEERLLNLYTYIPPPQIDVEIKVYGYSESRLDDQHASSERWATFSVRHFIDRNMPVAMVGDDAKHNRKHFNPPRRPGL